MNQNNESNWRSLDSLLLSELMKISPIVKFLNKKKSLYRQFPGIKVKDNTPFYITWREISSQDGYV